MNEFDLKTDNIIMRCKIDELEKQISCLKSELLEMRINLEEKIKGLQSFSYESHCKLFDMIKGGK